MPSHNSFSILYVGDLPYVAQSFLNSHIVGFQVSNRYHVSGIHFLRQLFVFRSPYSPCQCLSGPSPLVNSLQQNILLHSNRKKLRFRFPKLNNSLQFKQRSGGYELCYVDDEITVKALATQCDTVRCVVVPRTLCSLNSYVVQQYNCITYHGSFFHRLFG